MILLYDFVLYSNFIQFRPPLKTFRIDQASYRVLNSKSKPSDFHLRIVYKNSNK